MAQFYTDDICAFKLDPSIVGCVESTWRDVDRDPVDSTDCYVHRDTPIEVEHEFLVNLRPYTGYVTVTFEEPYDFRCLVPEASLRLVDRALSAGDAVKRHLSDAQSGYVLSTSLRCALRPSCSLDKYLTKRHAEPHGEFFQSAIVARLLSSVNNVDDVSDQLIDAPAGEMSIVAARLLSSLDNVDDELLDVPANELKHYNQYREEDYVIYQGWVGRIKDVISEITIRLGNGSVVAVECPQELSEPYWMPGTPSSKLHQSLRALGYRLNLTHKVSKRGRLWEADEYYPGQIVETKKGNLRRGRWKFGAYNPNVAPRGIVVDVRTTEIEVSWLFPNIFRPHRSQKVPPPSLLDVDTLESGEVTVYDHSRQPPTTSSAQPSLAQQRELKGASHSPDIGFGHRVRFRDVAGASVKYAGPVEGASNGIFKRIPRTDTQGYDMNVLQVTRVNTKVSIQWQDASITTEDSVSLVPYNNGDDFDVWPGNIVSLKAEEFDHKDADVTMCHRLGVVQSADARERIANVRWFSNSIAAIPKWNESQAVPPTRFGSISDTTSDVSLYDIVAYPGLDRARGDLLVVVPDPLPPIDRVSTSQHSAFQQFIARTYHNLAESVENVKDSNLGTQPLAGRYPTLAQSQTNMADRAFTSSANVSQPESSDNDWFGEMVDAGLDGTMTIRLGAADEVRDVKLPFERVVLVVKGNDESSDSDEEDSDEEANESWESDFVTDNDSNESSNPSVSIEVQYAGGQRLDDDSGDEMWSTDNDEEVPGVIPRPLNAGNDRQNPNHDDHSHGVIPVSSSGNEEEVSSDEEMPDLMPLSEDDEHLTRDERAPSSPSVPLGATPVAEVPRSLLMEQLDRGQRGIVEYPGQPFSERFQRLLDEYKRPGGRYHDQPSQVERTSAPGHHIPGHTIPGRTIPGYSIPASTWPPRRDTESAPARPIAMPPQFSILEEAAPNDHHFSSSSPSLTGAKMRRIIKEHQIMRTSLPEGVFVRTWETRFDLLRVLIVGPRETPYELAPFLIDFSFGANFPMKPPEAYFHSWTNGIGRVNPNLYEDGKICLSLLGTWPGDDGNDTWSAKSSTMLQVIVSLMGLVLVKEPFFNEAGFEILAGSEESTAPSALYTERAFVLSRGFVKTFLTNRPSGMTDVAEWIYISRHGSQLIDTIIEEAEALLVACTQDAHKEIAGDVKSWRPGNGTTRLSRGAAILLQRTVDSLRSLAMVVE